MFQRLSFQKKIFYMASIFFICTALGMSVIFYAYTYSKNVKDIEKFYIQTNQTIAADMDYLLADMEKLTTQLVANETVQKVFLEAEKDVGQNGLYFDYNIEQKARLQKECIALNTPIDNKGIINIYRSPNLFFTNSIGKEIPEHIRDSLRDCFEFKYTENGESRVIFVGPHEDPWLLSRDGSLFISILRPLVATYSGRNTVATIEMSESYAKVEKICRLSEQFKDMELLILDSGSGAVIYPYEKYSSEETQYYLQYGDLDGDLIEQIKSYDGRKMMLNVQRNERSGWVIFAMQPSGAYHQPLMNMTALLFSLLFVFALGMLFAIFYATNKLTMPIRDLKQAVKSVTLENIDIQMDNSRNNEIDSLRQVFSEILGRLRESANDLALAQSAEYEARIMALQAQINPHFLYNSLMAISAAGMENGNKKVEIMCGQLSELFRYAANEYCNVTFGAELDHVRTYLEFMKWRYMDTVEYCVDVDERICSTVVPRLILQPVVENCFVYAFHSILPPLRIQIRGRIKRGRWLIEIVDNGTGISEEELEKLKRLKRGVEDVLSHKSSGGHLEIDGKALINIFARLYLLCGESTVFTMENREGSGFCVILGGEWKADGRQDNP